MTHTLSRGLGAVALATSLASAAPALAQETEDPRPAYRVVAQSGDQPSPALVGRARRTVESEVVTLSGRLYLRGDVEAWSRRAVRIQRKECETCSWSRYTVTRSGTRGVFRAGIRAPRTGSTFWRAKVRAADGYARSVSATWETFYDG